MKYAALCVTLILLFMPCMAQAGMECQCDEEECICFLQLGDQGIAVTRVSQRMIDRGYLPGDARDMFDQDMFDAVCAVQREHDLPVTGLLDDDTLSVIIWGADSAVLDLTMPQSDGGCVYVPTNGGKKYHSRADCSGMHHPRRISLRNAKALNIGACKRCR